MSLRAGGPRDHVRPGVAIGVYWAVWPNMAHAVLTTGIGHLQSGFYILQHADNLLLGIAGSLHQWFSFGGR